MPFEHVIDDKNRMLIIRGSGFVAIEEVTDSLRFAIRFVAAGSLPSDFGVLINVFTVELMQPAQDKMLITQLVTILKKHLRGPMAIVTPTDGSLIESKMIDIYTAGACGPTKTFKTEPDAFLWIMANRS